MHPSSMDPSPASSLSCCTHSQRETCWLLYKCLCCSEEHTTWTWWLMFVYLSCFEIFQFSSKPPRHYATSDDARHIYTVKVGFTGEKAAWICGNIECGGSFLFVLLACSPGAFQAQSWCTQGEEHTSSGSGQQVSSLQMLWRHGVYCVFHQLLCLQSAFSVWPMIMSWHPCLHPSKQCVLLR